MTATGRTASTSLWGRDWDEVCADWTLDPEVTFLNHGSFGATPRPVLEKQNELRAEMERQPVKFLDRELPDRFAAALEVVGAFLGTSGRHLAFVPNATTGVNAVLQSLPFKPGDELLIPDIGYPAVIKTMTKVAEQRGARVVIHPVPFPRRSPGELCDAVLAGVTETTRLVVVDHISSPTALVFPVKQIVAACRERGIPVLVDAAHGPGMFDIDLDDLAPDFWTGNLHKWVCAPKGAAALYVRPELQSQIFPPITSHYFAGAFPSAFNWMGTDDPTAYLSVPAALEFMGSLDWRRVREHNHELARHGRRVVSEAIGIEPPYPDDDAFYGSMSLVALPDDIPAADRADAVAFQARLYERSRVEVPMVPLRGRAYLRLSAQVYNHPADYERLAEALRDLLKR